MNAKEFFNEFTKRVYSIPKIIKKYWKTDYSEFTQVIMTNVIDQIIISEYKLSHEYFRIDASGWVSRSDEIEEEAKNLGLIPHKWDLKIAVEHENNRRDWTDEVTKLLHIRCPLKVVIGYNDSCHRDNDLQSDIKKVFQVKEWMQSIEAFDQMPGNEEFLIILGNAVSQPQTDEPDKSIDYRAYLLQKNTNTHSLEITDY